MGWLRTERWSEAVGPVFWLSWLVGLVPYTKKGEESWEGRFVTVVALGVMLGVQAHFLNQGASFTLTTDTTALLLRSTETLLLMIIIAVNLVQVWRGGGQVRSVVRWLDEVETAVGEIGYSRVYPVSLVVTVMVPYVLHCLSVLGTRANPGLVDVGLVAGSGLPYLMAHLMQACFISLVYVVGRQLAALAKVVSRSASDPGQVVPLARLQSLLISTGEAVCAVYSVQLLLSILLCFMFLTSFSFYALLLLLPQATLSQNNPDLSLSLSTVVVNYNLLVLLNLAWACNYAKKQAAKCNDNLYDLMDDLREPRDYDKLLCHFATDRKLHFNSHGFVEIDFPMVTNIVASSITYVVILAQFQLVTPSDKLIGSNCTSASNPLIDTSTALPS